MLDEVTALPDDPDDLRTFAARLLAEVKVQAALIEKLRHQLAGHRAHRFGASSETAEQLQLALESSEIAAAAMTSRLRLPDVEEKDRPTAGRSRIMSRAWRSSSPPAKKAARVVVGHCAGSARTSPRSWNTSPVGSS